MDLADTLSAIGMTVDPQVLSYRHVYIDLGMRKEIPASTEAGAVERFDQATDLRPIFAQVRAPMLIYFSKDDPILSNPNERGAQSKGLYRILGEAAQNPHITVFNPPFGGHIGAVLDGIFEELIATFFKP